MMQLPPDRIPRFKSNLQVIGLGASGFCVLSESSTFLLEGAGMMRIVPLIDGIRSLAQIMNHVAGDVVADDARQALSILANAGYLEDACSAGPAPINALCNELHIAYPDAARLLAERPVQLLDLSRAPNDALLRLLAESGIRVAPSAAFTVVLCDDYRDPRIAALNQAFTAARKPWLIAKVSGFGIWLGPFFHAPDGPCWTCLDHRLTLNRHLVRYAERITGRRQTVALNTFAADAQRFQGYGALLMQMLRILLDRHDQSLHRNLHILDTLNFRTSTHAVVKRPDCTVCGDPRATASAAAYQPAIATVAARNMGGQRRESPEMTFERFKHHVDSVTGIVSAIEPSPYNFSTPLRVYSAGHNFALANGSPAIVRDSIRSCSSGKGRTDAEARTSALCEALERYCGVFQGHESRQSATLRELGSAAIDPRDCLLFSDVQYAERDKWLARRSRFQMVPNLFDPEARIEWSRVKKLGCEETKLLPTAQLYYAYPYQHDKLFGWADSNGCASGTTFEDACLQGLLELIERDAVAVWWYNEYQVSGYSPEDLGDDYYVLLDGYYKSIDREYWLLDLTHDLSVPVFCAVSRRVRGPTEDIIVGFGAHVVREIAVNRAVTEMNQFLPAVLSVGPDGITQYAFEDLETQAWWRTAKVSEKAFLLPRKSNRSFESGREPPVAAPVAHALQDVAEKIRAAGLEIYALDQTRGDVGLPVVRMIVPGLRHFWARFAPGRLYDVPVRLGYLTQPKREHELNPVPMFI
jgi:oxazoline/thiazoline synthase